jgi:hypothetical protein
MDNAKFQTEVLQRLAVLETLIKEQDYKGVSKTAEEAYTKSIKNEEDIKEMKEKNRWYFRTIIAAFLTAIVGIIISIFKSGIGMK